MCFVGTPKTFHLWKPGQPGFTVENMVMEFSRVFLGLTIALFHTRLADFLRKQDRELAAVFRQHGVPIPGALPKHAAHSLFFVLGIGIALLGLTRIWLTL